MNGHILQGTEIAVDYWKIRGKKKDFIHFLTHLHGDHIVGLTSTWMKPIYCSEVTAELLKIHYEISPSLLIVCPLNQSIIVQPPSSKSFTVTAWDANHCPGAVMFFFEGEFGNILYTGDFRSSPSLIRNCKYAFPTDILYLDNTFCNPRCNFPTQDECFSKMVDIVRKYPQHDIIIGVRSLGKECLLAKLGVALNESIYVLPHCYKITQLLLNTNVFKTGSLEKLSCRLRTMPMHQITKKLVDDLNKARPTIAIIPTAIFTGTDVQPFCRHPDIHVIPYSDHSNYQELVEFVSAIRPGKIFPIVTNTRGPFGSSFHDRLDMSCFNSLLSSNISVISRPNLHSEFKSTMLINECLEIANDFPTSHWNESFISSHNICKSAQSSYVNMTSPKAVSNPQSLRKRKQWHRNRLLVKRKATGVQFQDISNEADASSGTFESITSPATDLSWSQRGCISQSYIQNGGTKPRIAELNDTSETDMYMMLSNNLPNDQNVLLEQSGKDPNRQKILIENKNNLPIENGSSSDQTALMELLQENSTNSNVPIESNCNVFEADGNNDTGMAMPQFTKISDDPLFNLLSSPVKTNITDLEEKMPLLSEENTMAYLNGISLCDSGLLQVSNNSDINVQKLEPVVAKDKEVSESEDVLLTEDIYRSQNITAENNFITCKIIGNGELEKSRLQTDKVSQNINLEFNSGATKAKDMRKTGEVALLPKLNFCNQFTLQKELNVPHIGNIAHTDKNYLLQSHMCAEHSEQVTCNITELGGKQFQPDSSFSDHDLVSEDDSTFSDFKKTCTLKSGGVGSLFSKCFRKEINDAVKRYNLMDIFRTRQIVTYNLLLCSDSERNNIKNKKNTDPEMISSPSMNGRHRNYEILQSSDRQTAAWLRKSRVVKVKDFNKINKNLLLTDEDANK